MLLLLALFVSPTGAQTPPPPDLDALASELQESESLAADTRDRLGQTLERSRDLLDTARAQREEIEQLSARIAGSEETVAEFSSRVDALSAEAIPSPPEDAPLDTLETEIQLLLAERGSVSARRAEIESELATQSQEETSERARLAQLHTQLEQPAPVSVDSSASLEARVDAALARARRRQAETEAELLALRIRARPALDSIRVAERNWLDARIQRLDRRLARLSAAADAARQKAAQAQVESARAAGSSIGEEVPGLREIAAENLQLAESLASLNADLGNARDDIQQLRESVESIEREAALSRRRIAISGLQQEMADIMLTRLRSLPDRNSIENAIERRNRRINRVAIAAIDTDEDIRALQNWQTTLRRDDPRVAALSEDARETLDTLLSQRLQTLRDTAQAQARLQQILTDSNELSASLLASIRAYAEFLTSNLLWTRNYSYLSAERLSEQIGLLLSPAGVATLAAGLPRALLQPQAGLLILLSAGLLVFRRRIKRELQDRLGRPIRPSEEQVHRILIGYALTLGYLLPVPLVLLAFASALRNAGEGALQLQGIAEGLAFIALLVFGFGLLRHLAGRIGVGRRLLKWNGQKMDHLRPALSWLAPLSVAAGFFTAFSRSVAPTESGGPMNAIASLTVVIALLVFSLRALRSDLFKADRLVTYGFRGVALLTTAIAIMHITGHLFAAHLYLDSLALSIAACIAVLLIINTLYRIVLILHGRIERRARDEQRSGDSTEGEPNIDSVDDLSAVASLSGANTQLLGLMKIAGLALALWFIWSPALPALNIFSDIELWSAADSALPAGELRSISLATLINALFVLFVTALLTRHVPALIDVLLMEWSKVSAGSRYAIRMLLQYVIIGTGLAMSLSMLGWEWSKVQWLVAALGVGIGFGLQEIVANFISGLILLFERPIRVGDIISAGGGDGTVTKINARATVIESFEGKELMIPNKELITGVVTNWSLSTSNLRVVVPVGVAYGTDVREAMRILVEVAHDNPSVLKDPEPTATFEDFGDNALTLWLRCYAEKEYPRVWTELRTVINERFIEAGISISFPQRDVHLDAEKPIPVRIWRAHEDSNLGPPA